MTETHELVQMVDQSADELVGLLQDLVRIPSVNTGAPESGHETTVAEMLKRRLEAEGIECEILESAPGRGNLIARLSAASGEMREEPILLMSHLDVVPEGAQDAWTYPPFSATVKDGRVYGRGSSDCKSLVASEAMTLILLKRAGVSLRGDLILAAGADEEAGGKYGFAWLAEHHPDKLRAGFALNEGGGASVRNPEGKLAYLFNTGEKGRHEVHLRFKGRAGHAAWPWRGDNALAKAGRLLEAIRAYTPEINVDHPVFTRLPRFMGIDDEVTPQSIDRIADRFVAEQPGLAANLRAMSRMTFVPTMIDAGLKSNSIPDTCHLTCDIRTLPHQDESYVRDQIERVIAAAGLSGNDLDVELITTAVPSSSPYTEEIGEATRQALCLALGLDPDAGRDTLEFIPAICNGFTDSRLVRPVGTPVYDFAPSHPDANPNIANVHGVNESSDIQSLLVCTRMMVALASGMLR